jgi:hypothetical protein
MGYYRLTTSEEYYGSASTPQTEWEGRETVTIHNEITPLMLDGSRYEHNGVAYEYQSGKGWVKKEGK